MLRAMIAEGLRPVALGIAIGLVVAFGASQLMARLLFGVGTADATAYAAVVIVLAASAVVATWIGSARDARLWIR